MRVLVTGNAGFIGAHFVGWLLTHDPDVTIVGFNRNSDQGNQVRVEGLISEYAPKQWQFDQSRDATPDVDWARFKQVYGDLTDPSLSGICEDIDTVVHFAAKTFVDHSLKDAEPFIQSNIIGTHRLMDDAHRYGVRRFMQVSTDEVYGQILEGQYREDATLNPRNPYAWTKAAADLDGIWRHRTYGFPVIITRTENNYGPWQHRQKALPVFIRKGMAGEPLPVYGDGQHVRCWLYVEDHCSAIWHLAQHGEVGEVYNVAGEQELTNLSLAKMVLNLLGKPDGPIEFVDDRNVRPGHDRRYALDVSKLRATGWAPQWTLINGMAHTVKWYQDNAWWLL